MNSKMSAAGRRTTSKVVYVLMECLKRGWKCQKVGGVVKTKAAYIAPNNVGTVLYQCADSRVIKDRSWGEIDSECLADRRCKTNLQGRGVHGCE
jgi:hypothetical protein